MAGCQKRTWARILSVLIAWLLIFPMPSFAEEAQLAHIYKQAVGINEKLITIANNLGMPHDTDFHYKTTSVTIGIIGYQAQVLLSKCASLQNEITGGDNIELKPAIRTQGNSTIIIESLDAANNAITAILKSLNSSNNGSASESSSTDDIKIAIYMSLMSSIQMIDVLLENQARPRDTYRNITLASYYAGEIMSHMPGITVMTEENEFTANKKPQDVFELLVIAIQKLNQELAKHDIPNVTIVPVSINDSAITAYDTFNLSSLIIAQLSHVASIKKINLSNITSFNPGKIQPSKVYQRATLLLKQIEKMCDYLKKHPDWFNENVTSSK